ncbi:MAG: hypothetical protein KatS3mg118_2666 [Paracoccaceae bacterium]|nr:MAG: hypothetical protein KatS3mg118_2666 [Paracoccaceae bacterium]
MRGHNRPHVRPRLPGTDLPARGVPTAIIHRPARSATSSGPRPDHWVLEFEPARPARIEPLMGWTAGDDPFRGIRLVFPDRDSAVEFAERQDWRYVVLDDRPARPVPNPWRGHTAHRLHRGADAPGAHRIAGAPAPQAGHRLHRGARRRGRSTSPAAAAPTVSIRCSRPTSNPSPPRIPRPGPAPPSPRAGAARDPLSGYGRAALSAGGGVAADRRQCPRVPVAARPVRRGRSNASCSTMRWCPRGSSGRWPPWRPATGPPS